VQTFLGHRDTITGITFDKENDQFYTVSNDRALKVWNIREMMYMDSHYGHQADIFAIEKYSKDRVISCGLDRQVIFWKINEDSELLYRNPDHFTDSVNVINNHYFVTTSTTDNCMDLWIMNKKKPVGSILDCHQPNSLLLSSTSVKNTDLLATGGTDGTVQLYQF
jgi:ribosomal RNA-processing protein 9